MRSDGTTRPEICTLVEADERFNGHAWVELHAQAQVQKEQKEIAATADRQSKTELRAAADAIVSSAAKQTAAAQTGQSKRTRLGGIRANRKAEREHERRLSVAQGSLEEEELIEDIGPEESQEPGDDSYIPPTCYVALIKQQLEQQ